MKPTKLLYLILAAGLLLAVASWSAKRQHAAPPSQIGRSLLPQLDLDAIGRIEIAGTGAPYAIVRGDDGWSVDSLFGFPADVAKLRVSLLKLKDLKIGDVARGMNLDTNCTLVDFQNASGKPLTTLRLGKHYQRPGTTAPGGYAEGRYVAVAGDPHVYLVKETLDDFDADGKAWVDTQLVNIPATDIQTVELAAPTGGVVVTLSRTTGTLQLQGLATNEEFDASKSYGIESALSYLTLTGVANPKLDDAKLGLTAPFTCRFHLKNGDLYTALLGQAVTNGTDRYLRLNVALAAPGTNATQQADVEKRKADIDRKFSHWTYLISSYTAENMTRSRADLVKPKTIVTNAAVTATSP